MLGIVLGNFQISSFNNLLIITNMAKTGKDREGSYHPPKGKPSGRGIEKEEEAGIDAAIAEKYSDEDDLPGNIRVRHPNRNPDKKETRNGKKNTITAAKNSTLIADAPEAEGKPLLLEEITELNAEAIKTLTSFQSQPSISIYLTTHSSGLEVNERMDFIAFKNAVQQVTSSLKARNVDDETIKRITSPAHQLLKADNFWNNLTPGLAVFLADGFSKFYKMPLGPSEQVYINSSFMVKPLTRVILSNEYYYVLVISKKQSQLYRADEFGIKHIPISEMPNGIEDVVHFENKDDQKLFRTGSSGGGQGANYHGIGAGKPDDKENIKMYLDEVDETIWKEVLSRENKPLVIAAVEYIHPIFKEVSNYNFIWPEGLTGSYETTDLNKLHSKSLELVRPHFEQNKKRALEQYGNKSATPLTTSNFDEVIPAAYYGRVDTLFVKKDSELWGTFDEQDSILHIHPTRQDDDESMVDKTIMKTITNGGMVYEIDEEEMPVKGAQFAALLRY
jgi:hypothetical protein